MTQIQQLRRITSMGGRLNRRLHWAGTQEKRISGATRRVGTEHR